MEAAGDQPQHPTVDIAKQVIRSLEDKLRAYNLKPQRRQPTMVPSAYDPIDISFGPFHKDKLEVQATRKLKLRFLQNLLLRSLGTDLCDLYAAISVQVEEIRGQYSEEFPEMTDADFGIMLMVDGCFILELMIMKSGYQTRANAINLPYKDWQMANLINGLFLLENQIPFSVLETLYTALGPHPFDFCTSLRELAFISVVAPGAPPNVVPAGIEDRKFHHFTSNTLAM